MGRFVGLLVRLERAARSLSAHGRGAAQVLDRTVRLVRLRLRA